MKLEIRVLAVKSIIAMVVLGIGQAYSQNPTKPAGPVSAQSIDQPLYTPRGLNGAATDVVIQLSGQSVAEVQAALGRKLTDSEKSQIKRSLKAVQDSLAGSIQNAGGTVMNQFQSAINGIKVRIAPDRVDQLKTLPNVVDVLPVQLFTISNTTSVPYIGAPAVWNTPSPNLRGEGIKIGIIDTGIDYTHANFGGPGTPADFAAAFAASTSPANPLLFGPGAPKVKGGYDFVGDNYNAGGTAAQQIPNPDPNPLDCNGHGSHVAGTAAGFGVTGAGATYPGPYNPSIYAPGAFIIGPGVAPKADLYAYRVFGCSGSTSVVVDAIDHAVADDMDVINMSLGSPFGTARDADAVAATNAAKAGLVVVISAGNQGPNPYLLGGPASGDGAISVAANDAHQSFPGATITLNATTTIKAINANEAAFTDGTTYNVLTLFDNPATSTVDESLGCNLSDYPTPPPLPANTLVVVNRGVCGRVHKAIIGQQMGAAAVAMVNNTTDLPPLEGPITSDPDTGATLIVTIPFLGVRGVPGNSASDGAKLRADTGGSATVSNTTLPNATFSKVADFSSGGPRNGDSVLKPEITAPGVGVFSTSIGTGIGGVFFSGTSMSAPHISGVAALAVQAHPTWKEEELKAAIVSTGNPGAVAGFSARLAGAGLAQPFAAVRTNAFAMGDDHGNVALNFGYQELNNDLNKPGHIKIRNRGPSPVTFNVSVSNQSGVPHTLTPKDTAVTVPGNGDKDLELRLNVPVATVGDSSAFHDAAGIVNLSPAGNGNNGVALHVPYYLVPRALSNEDAKAEGPGEIKASSPSTTVTVTNKKDAAIAGSADFYAWGIHDDKDKGKTSNDIRDVGVQAFQNAGGAGNPLLVFGINTYDRWSNASTNEFDIYVDVDPQNNNGDDYVIVGFDYGAITAGSFNGQFGTFVFSTRSSKVSYLPPAYTFAPTDSTTAELAVLASQLCRSGEPCLKTSNPRFTYHIVSFDNTSPSVDVVPAVAAFNAFSPSMSTGAFLGPIPPGGSASTTIAIVPAEWAITPALGALVITPDNKAGQEEAQEVKLVLKK